MKKYAFLIVLSVLLTSCATNDAGTKNNKSGTTAPSAESPLDEHEEWIKTLKRQNT